MKAYLRLGVLLIVFTLFIFPVSVTAASNDSVFFLTTPLTVRLPEPQEGEATFVNSMFLREEGLYYSVSFLTPDGEINRSAIYLYDLETLENALLFEEDSVHQSYSGLRQLLKVGNDLMFASQFEQWELRSLDLETKELVTVTSLTLEGALPPYVQAVGAKAYWIDGQMGDAKVYSYDTETGETTALGAIDGEYGHLLFADNNPVYWSPHDRGVSVHFVDPALDEESRAVVIESMTTALAASDGYVFGIDESASAGEISLVIADLTTDETQTVRFDEPLETVYHARILGDYVFVLAEWEASTGVLVWSVQSGESLLVPASDRIIALHHGPYNTLYGMTAANNEAFQIQIIK